MQTTDSIFMVRPSLFKANPDTALTNHFQQCTTEGVDAHPQALRAFDHYVNALRLAGVNVMVFDDSTDSGTPDALFPNNWITSHRDGKVITFPMEAINRRRERKQAIIDQIADKFIVTKHIDLSHHEQAGHFLEGTGSLVLDHEHKVAYICHSSRSSPRVVAEFQQITGYQAIWFHAYDERHFPIYHTNVMMSIGQHFAVVCLESITHSEQRQQVCRSLMASGRTLIDINLRQMVAFCANVLELKSVKGTPVLALSTQAWQAFTSHQQRLLQEYATLALAPIDIIEKFGGGGARCMVAEIFLPPYPDCRVSQAIPDMP